LLTAYTTGTGGAREKGGKRLDFYNNWGGGGRPKKGKGGRLKRIGFTEKKKKKMATCDAKG